MKKQIIAATAAGALAVTGGLAVQPAAAAGDKSLATVLTSDKNKFDKNGADFDITTEAVLAVLAAKPDSAVKVLTDGSVRLTAFAPTDQAFRLLVEDLTGKTVKSEKKVFAAVAGLGIDTVETVLLYHVVPGATITGKKAAMSNGTKLTTAQGGKLTVLVKKNAHSNVVIKLRDQDKNDANATVTAADINKGNKQIAHGINRVLRPLDL